MICERYYTCGYSLLCHDLHYSKNQRICLKEKKMKENKTTVNGGIGFTGLLTIVFIVLKLTNVIEWSWIWVLSPIWISILLVWAIIVGLLIFERWLNR